MCFMFPLVLILPNKCLFRSQFFTILLDELTQLNMLQGLFNFRQETIQFYKAMVCFSIRIVVSLKNRTLCFYLTCEVHVSRITNFTWMINFITRFFDEPIQPGKLVLIINIYHIMYFPLNYLCVHATHVLSAFLQVFITFESVSV